MSFVCLWNHEKLRFLFFVSLGLIIVVLVPTAESLSLSFGKHLPIKRLERIRSNDRNAYTIHNNNNDSLERKQQTIVNHYDDKYNFHNNNNRNHRSTTPSKNILTNQEVSHDNHHNGKKQTKNSDGRKRRKFSGYKNYIKNNPGAYANLSENELKNMTQTLLNKYEVGEMTGQSLHEIQKLIASWSKRRHSSMKGTMSELLLRRMILENKMGNTNARISVNLFNSVIHAWVKCGSDNGLEKAIHILDLMNEQKFNDVENLKATSKCYVAILDGWYKSKNPGSVEAATEVLNDLVTLPFSQVETRHFNLVMNSWAERKGENSTQYVYNLLDDMILLYQKGNTRVKPNTGTYNILLKSIIQSKKRNYLYEADSLLREMEASLSNDDDSVVARPDRISYTTVLLGWAKSKHSKAIEKATNILSRMERQAKLGYSSSVKPDTMTYNILLNALASIQKKDSAEQCVKILFKMEKLHEFGDRNVKPDVISYNTVMNAYAKSTRRRASQKALSLLNHMEICHQCNPYKAKPDIITYNSVLSTVSRSKNQSAPFKAEEILYDLEKKYLSGQSDVKPDLYTYNIVMSSWANSGREDAGEKAEAIFKRIIDLYERGDSSLAPDTTTYNTLLLSWSRTQSNYSAGRAQLIFDKMLDLYNSGNRNVQPTVQSFVAVINAWSKSKDPFKAQKAQLQLEKMKELSKTIHHLQPNIFVYTSVLNSCAYTFGKIEYRQQAMDIAVEILGEMQNSPDIKLNHVAYGTFLKACRSLLREDTTRKNSLIEATVRQCIRDGQMGEIVLRQLVDIDPPEFKVKLLRRLSSNTVLSVDDIPNEWSSNVKDRRISSQ